MMDWNLVAYVVMTGFVAWASFSIRRIHKMNQDVQLHNIGDLTEKEVELLGNEKGNSWLMRNGQFVRGSAGEINVGDYHGARKIGSKKQYSIHPIGGEAGEPVSIDEYGDAMKRLLVYGLMAMMIGWDGRQSKWVIMRTEYGEIEYLRQIGRRRSMLKRCVRALVGPMWRWTE